MLKFVAAVLGLVLFCSQANADYFEGRYYKPYDRTASCDAGETPSLIVGFHGGYGWWWSFRNSSQLHNKATCAVVVFPAALTATSRTWNTHRPFDWTPADEQEPDDIGWAQRLIVHLEGVYETDRVFVVGMSNGGEMAYSLGCHYPDLIDAVGAVSMSYNHPDCPAPPSAVALKHVHGTNDSTIPIGGGPNSPPIEDGIEAWRIGNGCSADGDTETLDQSWQYLGCTEPVQYRAVFGMAHEWDTASYDTTYWMMEFFQAQ